MSVSYEVPEKSGRGSPGINKEIYPFLYVSVKQLQV